MVWLHDKFCVAFTVSFKLKTLCSWRVIAVIANRRHEIFHCNLEVNLHQTINENTRDHNEIFSFLNISCLKPERMNIRSSLTDFKEVEKAQILFSQTSKVIFSFLEHS